MLVAPLTSISFGAASNSLSVTGYVEQGSEPELIDGSAHALTSVDVDGINLTTDGADVSTPDNSTPLLLARAHRDGLRGELLIGNIDSSIGDFSSRIATSLLRIPLNTHRVAQRLCAIVEAQ